MSNNICLQCNRNPRRPGYTFCSDVCSKNAAKTAPRLLKVPKTHVMYREAVAEFNQRWRTGVKPRVKTMYLVTWTPGLSSSYDTYRNAIENKRPYGPFAGFKNKRGLRMTRGNEKKLFRGSRCGCGVAVTTLALCNQPSCKVCWEIRHGFGARINALRSNLPKTYRLGAGVYSSHTPSKAYNYALPVSGARKRYTVLSICRVIVGNPYDTPTELRRIAQPPNKHDAVYAKPGKVFKDDEFVVYNPNAIRTTFLLVLS